MANTFTLTSGSYQGRYMEVYCTQEIDIATNRSRIHWTLSSKGGTSNYYSTGATTLIISGQTVYSQARVNWDAKVFPAAKGSTSGTTDWIKHNDDGSQGINVSLKTAIYVGTVSEYTKYWQLDNIPRQATLISVPDFTDLDNPTITYSNPAGNAVTHLDACISLTGAKDDIPYRAISKTGNSYTFNLTEEERNTLRNATTTGTREVSFFVRTIIGEQYFYYSTIKRLTIRETDNTKPSVTMTATLNNGNLPSEFASMCIQGKSRLNISLTAQGKYGASITNHSVFVGGNTYYASSFTSDVLANSGYYDIVASARDTRGFTGTATKQIEVTAYSKPLVVPIGNENAILCYRSDGNGVRVGNSTSVWIKAKRSYYNLSQNNKCGLQWRRKPIAATWDDSVHKWQDLLEEDSPTDEYNGLILYEAFEEDAEFDVKESYSIQIRAIDFLGEYDIKEFEIPTQDVALHLGKGGKNVAVGTYCDYSEDYTFYSEWKAIFDNGVYIGENKYPISDFVIEQGTIGIWKYEKWASGKSICYGSKRYDDLTTPQSWGSGFFADILDFDSFPTGCFNAAPVAFLSIYGNGLRSIQISGLYKDHIDIRVNDMGNQANTATISVYAIGRWK